jgi:hypothetical protein
MRRTYPCWSAYANTAIASAKLATRKFTESLRTSPFALAGMAARAAALYRNEDSTQRRGRTYHESYIPG